MPLHDHFSPPLSERRHWRSFLAAWAGSLADQLNQRVLPKRFVALETVRYGSTTEIDLTVFEPASAGLQILPEVWTPAVAPLVAPATFADEITVSVWDEGGGRTLVAAIELVSPGNKDREVKRKLFAAKCATYLSRGVGLVIVDVVTSRQANLHNELLGLLGLGAGFEMPPGQSLYAAAYRPLRREAGGVIEAWPMALTVGQPLPTVPLSLEAEWCVPVDLETAYADTCQRRRVGEVFA